MPPSALEPTSDDPDSLEDDEMDEVAAAAAPSAFNNPMAFNNPSFNQAHAALLRSPRASPVLALPAPGVEGGGDDTDPAAAAAASSAVLQRSRREQAYRQYECESRSSSSESAEGDADTSPARPPAAQPKKPPSLVSMANGLFVEAGYPNLDALADADKRFDIDGFSIIFRGETMQRDLERATGDLRIPIHPIGADLAKQRMLYDPARFAMVGLAQPERRLGMGIAIERNRGGLSLDDVGTQVDLGGLWGRTSLTADLVDGGLNQVHKFLTVEADGQHFAAKGLERLDAGSHGVWAPHSSFMFYKLVEATVRCDLAILIFDFGQKAMCAALHPPALPRPLSPPFALSAESTHPIESQPSGRASCPSWMWHSSTVVPSGWTWGSRCLGSGPSMCQPRLHHPRCERPASSRPCRHMAAEPSNGTGRGRLQRGSA